MSYFILQAKDKLEEGAQAYSIPGIRDVYGNPQDNIRPTAISQDIGLLEWIIPNNQFNQHWISEHYSHFKILEPGQEAKLRSIDLMPGMPSLDSVAVDTASITVQSLPVNESVEIMDATEVRLNGITEENPDGSTNTILAPIEDAEVIEDKVKTKAEEIKELKDKRLSELARLGVKAPKNSSLKKLDKLIQEAVESKSED